jgi:hypothetical protein
MENILGETKDLIFYNKEGVPVYEFSAWKSGNAYEYTFDKHGYTLTYKNSKGYYLECTRDDEGNELTYKDSEGVERGFEIPEFTMEELTQKLGNFKIKK